MTFFPYNGDYFQNWKLTDCQHTSPDEMGTEWQAPNTNVEAPNTNVGQKTSPDEMESEQECQTFGTRTQTLQAPQQLAQVIVFVPRSK